MIKELDYGASGMHSGLFEVTVDQVRNTLERMPPAHRLCYILTRIETNDYSPFVDIVPGLADYLSKSGIFEGYDV